MPQLLEFEPKEGIRFSGPYTRPSLSKLVLKNTGSTGAVAYKLKTLDPSRYIVRPSKGIIGPGKSVEVTFKLYPIVDLPSFKHASQMFLLQTVPVNGNFQVDDVDQLFLKAKSSINSVKISATFEGLGSSTGSTSSSTTSSPKQKQKSLTIFGNKEKVEKSKSLSSKSLDKIVAAKEVSAKKKVAVKSSEKSKSSSKGTDVNVGVSKSKSSTRKKFTSFSKESLVGKAVILPSETAKALGKGLASSVKQEKSKTLKTEVEKKENLNFPFPPLSLPTSPKSSAKEKEKSSTATSKSYAAALKSDKSSKSAEKGPSPKMKSSVIYPPPLQIPSKSGKLQALGQKSSKAPKSEKPKAEVSSSSKKVSTARQPVSKLKTLPKSTGKLAGPSRTTAKSTKSVSKSEKLEKTTKSSSNVKTKGSGVSVVPASSVSTVKSTVIKEVSSTITPRKSIVVPVSSKTLKEASSSTKPRANILTVKPKLPLTLKSQKLLSSSAKLADPSRIASSMPKVVIGKEQPKSNIKSNSSQGTALSIDLKATKEADRKSIVKVVSSPVSKTSGPAQQQVDVQKSSPSPSSSLSGSPKITGLETKKDKSIKEISSKKITTSPSKSVKSSNSFSEKSKEVDIFQSITSMGKKEKSIVQKGKDEDHPKKETSAAKGESVVKVDKEEVVKKKENFTTFPTSIALVGLSLLAGLIAYRLYRTTFSRRL